MTHSQIREKFLKFFESRGHKIVPSSSLLPTDLSVLFTTAGMQQFKPYYTGQGDALKDFGSLNTVSIQKCLRTSDIDEVGDESHLTFFEMLGNFSFGGYWKKEAIEYAHEFVTKEMGLKIDYVSVFGGEDSVPADEESEKIWKSIDANIEVRKAGKADNFWGPTGDEGPCGPTTEIYVDGVEIWNIVFNEYYQTADKQLKPLEIKGIDTGMGLERLAMVVQNKKNIFETDLFEPIIKKTRESISGISAKSERVIADHLRASLFLIADGVVPSNKDQGYILRRLIRRAITHANILNMNFDSKDLKSVATLVVETYKNYPELKNEGVLEELSLETRKFRKTIENGLRVLSKEMIVREVGPNGEYGPVPDLSPIEGFPAFLPHEITGTWLHDFYQKFGFPYELTLEVIQQRPGRKKLLPFQIDKIKKEFEEESKRHQEISRAGVKAKFGGHGLLLDTGELKAGNEEELKKATRLHTATHLLHASLRKVLGNEVHQAGSDITPERLRFDFTFPRKITPEELKKAEDIANDIVNKDLPVTATEMDLQEALDSGASAFFKLKYPPRVKVYTIGDDKNWFSRELCGGPHISHTKEIGHITITKEESVSGGNRRIRATVN